MTTDQVRQLFEKKYTVGAFIFIEDLEHQPSSLIPYLKAEQAMARASVTLYGIKT